MKLALSTLNSVPQIINNSWDAWMFTPRESCNNSLALCMFELIIQMEHLSPSSPDRGHLINNFL